MEQLSIFDFIDNGIKPYGINKTIRLIELFG
jgi:hypothetical protein